MLLIYMPQKNAAHTHTHTRTRTYSGSHKFLYLISVFLCVAYTQRLPAAYA